MSVLCRRGELRSPAGPPLWGGWLRVSADGRGCGTVSWYNASSVSPMGCHLPHWGRHCGCAAYRKGGMLCFRIGTGEYRTRSLASPYGGGAPQGRRGPSQSPSVTAPPVGEPRGAAKARKMLRHRINGCPSRRRCRFCVWMLPRSLRPSAGASGTGSPDGPAAFPSDWRCG